MWLRNKGSRILSAFVQSKYFIIKVQVTRQIYSQVTAYSFHVIFYSSRPMNGSECLSTFLSKSDSRFHLFNPISIVTSL
jgi:hypothetical protein